MSSVPRTLLIADDHEPVLRTLEFVLGARGYRVVTALSGKAALEVARIEEVDAALIDLYMPGMDGFRTCEALLTQARESARPLCVFVMTAAFSSVAEKRALEIGAVTLLHKPFNCDELAVTLEKQFGTTPVVPTPILRDSTP